MTQPKKEVELKSIRYTRVIWRENFSESSRIEVGDFCLLLEHSLEDIMLPEKKEKQIQNHAMLFARLRDIKDKYSD